MYGDITINPVIQLKQILKRRRNADNRNVLSHSLTAWGPERWGSHSMWGGEEGSPPSPPWLAHGRPQDPSYETPSMCLWGSRFLLFLQVISHWIWAHSVTLFETHRQERHWGHLLRYGRLNFNTRAIEEQESASKRITFFSHAVYVLIPALPGVLTPNSNFHLNV
jgi:hypothetical protein